MTSTPASNTDTSTETIKSACSYCGVGCGILIETTTDAETGRRTVVKVSGDKDHPANRGRLCTKGATSAEMANAPGRLTQAHVRPERGAPLEPRNTSAVITETAQRLTRIIEEHGPEAVSLSNATPAPTSFIKTSCTPGRTMVCSRT